MSGFSEYLQRVLFWQRGSVAQIITPSGTRVNATAGAASTVEAALPAGAKALRISSDQPAWIRFGAAGIGAAAADANSMYFPAGVEIIGVPINSSGVLLGFFRAIRAGGTDAVIQFEAIL